MPGHTLPLTTRSVAADCTDGGYEIVIKAAKVVEKPAICETAKKSAIPTATAVRHYRRLQATTSAQPTTALQAPATATLPVLMTPPVIVQEK